MNCEVEELRITGRALEKERGREEATGERHLQYRRLVYSIIAVQYDSRHVNDDIMEI